MSENFGKVRSFAGDETFLMGARDLGIGTVEAVSELVDNSIDAEAEEIHVKVGKNGENLRIYVEDDGIGIRQTIEHDGEEYDGLPYVLSFGGRQKDRDVEIGKFGWGLSSSATCQSNLTRVWTKRPDEDDWRFTEVDLEEMDSSGDTTPPDSEYREFDDHLDIENPDKESGTLVVFEEADRADYTRAGDARNALVKELSRVYRQYLRGGRTITVNGKELQPYDPLYRWGDAYNPYDIPTVDDLYYEDSFEMEPNEEHLDDEYTVKVRIAWLDVEAIRKKEDWSGSWMGKVGLTEENQGFYLVRNGREIGGGLSFGLFTRHADKNYFRGEIEFPPELDYYFGITTNKSKFSLKQEMRDKLNDSIDNIPNQIHNRTRNLISELEAKAEKESRDQDQTLTEEIAEDADRLLKSREKLDEDEEEELEEELEKEKEEKIQEIENDDSLDDEEKEEEKDRIKKEYRGYMEYPFKITYDTLPSGQFYEVEKKGKQTRVILNDGHEFFDVYEKATQNSQERIHLDLLLMSAAHAEDYYSDKEEMQRYLNEWRTEWSTALRVFLDQTPDTVDEAMKEIRDPIAGDD
ncbi:ATP-binding protein [Haloarchaeobius sp. HRN-SO-5]|uniref:ATP-binding protein n=1 Tax=Haloarchaeobius sp. HRN-SO-5 TaxID=3446118 RepID=UPI003EBD78F3